MIAESKVSPHFTLLSGGFTRFPSTAPPGTKVPANFRDSALAVRQVRENHSGTSYVLVLMIAQNEGFPLYFLRTKEANEKFKSPLHQNGNYSVSGTSSSLLISSLDCTIS